MYVQGGAGWWGWEMEFWDFGGGFSGGVPSATADLG